MREKDFKNRGITLIALVVTIVVLLILAGISISMLTGQNGILNRAAEAKEKTEISSKEEQRKNLESEQAADEDKDPFLQEAIDTVVETGQASTSFIQRRFKVGYARAGRIIDQMEERGVISGYQGSKPREVLWTLEKLAEMKMGASQEE